AAHAAHRTHGDELATDRAGGHRCPARPSHRRRVARHRRQAGPEAGQPDAHHGDAVELPPAGRGSAGAAAVAGDGRAGERTWTGLNGHDAMSAIPGRRWTEDDGIHIDVRGLPAPEPLVAILELIGSSQDDSAVIVHHARDPRMLYPELAELGWSAEQIDGEAGEVRLRLARGS